MTTNTITRNLRSLSLVTLLGFSLSACIVSVTDGDDSDDEFGMDTDTEADSTGDTETSTDDDVGTDSTGTDSTSETADETETDTDTTTEETDTETTGVEGLEIAGEYTDEWGSSHSITDESWGYDTALFHVDSYDNDGDYLIAENDSANEYFPGPWVYSRFDWAWDGDSLYYCQTAYDAMSIEDAQAAMADAEDLVGAGCGGFPWTLMN